VFYLFFLVLLDLPNEAAGARFGARWPLAVVAGFVFAVVAWFAYDPLLVPTAEVTSSGVPATAGLAGVGTLMFGQFALPFEIASLILLAAIVGAVVLARRKTEA
jgi:NADH-quinone oxidoreductase subunit J